MFVLLALFVHVHVFAFLHLSLVADVTLNTALDYLNRGGVLALLILILFGGWRKWWVFGWYFKDGETRNDAMRKERDDWRDMALHSTNLAEQSVDLFRRSRDTK